jgi:ubiquinol-cytochrome c reductase iron-sulfur subunit
MSKDSVDHNRRRLLTITSGVGAAGVVGAAVPFVMSMEPSARALAAGAPVEVSLAKIEPGQMITVQWRGKPVWVVNRTPEMLAELKKDTSMLVDPDSKVDHQPPYVGKITRSIKPQWLVLIGVCTHLGCTPKPRFTIGSASGLGATWPGGWLCPCHGSKFDFSGRVLKNVPAPTNLYVPPYKYLSDTRILIGVDTKVGAAAKKKKGAA